MQDRRNRYSEVLSPKDLKVQFRFTIEITPGCKGYKRYLYVLFVKTSALCSPPYEPSTHSRHPQLNPQVEIV